jgi:hypothetical protein
VTAPGVSGPGALSQRTDRSPAAQPQRVPSGMPYGDATAMHQAEQAAPMAQAASVPSVAPSSLSFAPATATPPALLSDPTQRPGEPVTHGADAGPGADSSILAAMPGQPAGGMVSQAISKAAASDTTGVLAQLLLAAQQKGL